MHRIVYASSSSCWVVSALVILNFEFRLDASCALHFFPSTLWILYLKPLILCHRAARNCSSRNTTSSTTTGSSYITTSSSYTTTGSSYAGHHQPSSASPPSTTPPPAFPQTWWDQIPTVASDIRLSASFPFPRFIKCKASISLKILQNLGASYIFPFSKCPVYMNVHDSCR